MSAAITRVRRWAPGIAAGVAAVGVLVTTCLTLPDLYVVWLIAVGIVWVAPGVVALLRAYRDSHSRWGMALLAGPAFGYALSSLVLLGLWVLGIRTGWLLLACPLIAIALAWFAPSLGPRLNVPRFGRRDVLAVSLLLLLVPLVLARPYSRVGADLPEGRAYRAYFTADFVWAMAVVSEVSKGHVLPENPFHIGMRLHYYWVPHLMPALEHRTLGRAVRLDRLLLVDAALSAVLFLGFLYALAKHVARSASAALLGCVVAVLFTSPEGSYALYDLWSQERPLSLVRYLNIDALSRWFFGALPIDGLQRLLLYQPQHQIGYALSCTALLVMVQQVRRPRVAAAAFAGLLLGCGLLISTFAALMVAMMIGFVAAVAIVRAGAWRVGALQAVAAAVPLVSAVWVSRRLEYVTGGGQLVDLLPNPLAARHPLSGPVLSMGPVLLLLSIGVWFAARRRRGYEPILLPGTAFAVCVLFYFFVDVRDHQDVYVGWRAGHLIFITCAGALGWTLWRLVHVSARRRSLVGLAIAALCVLTTVPTVAIDLYNVQDISNRQPAAGFPWTLILGHDELNALHWIATQTPVDARVQAEPIARDPATWAYVPAFGERRMSAGLPISMIPLKPYEDLSWRVRRMYDSTDPVFVVHEVNALHIDVLVVGPEEHKRHPQFRDLLDSNPHAFPALFRTRNISLYAASGRMRRQLMTRR